MTLALVGTTHLAQAQMTGNQLYQNCSGQDPMEVGLCYGFIEGVFFDTADSLPLCGYEGATYRQFRDIGFQYLHTHPAERHELANRLVARAMKEAFPCPK